MKLRALGETVSQCIAVGESESAARASIYPLKKTNFVG